MAAIPNAASSGTQAPLYPPTSLPNTTQPSVKYTPGTPTRQSPPKPFEPFTNQYPTRYRPPGTKTPVSPKPFEPFTNQYPNNYKPSSPTRINLPPEAAPAGGIAAAEALGGGAAGAGLGKLLLRLPLILAPFEFLLFPSPTAKTPYEAQFDIPEPPQPIQVANPPFYGGQSEKVLYIVRIEQYYKTTLQPAGSPSYYAYGPILGIQSFPATQNSLFTVALVSTKYEGGLNYNVIETSTTGESAFIYKIREIFRPDSRPDTGGNPPPTTPPIYSQPTAPVITPSPAPPNQAPSPALPTPVNPISPAETPTKREPAAPLPIARPSSPPTPTIEQPPLIGQPAIPEIPLEFPRQSDPQPDFGPNLPFPQQVPAPTAAPTATPTNTPIPTPADPTKYPDTGFQPNIFTPSKPFEPTPLTASPLKPTTFKPNPTTGKPEPETPTPTTPERSPDPEPTPLDKFRNDVNKVLTPLGVTVAGIAALLNPVGGKLDQIQNQTNPEAIKNAAKAATCQTMEPGGCSYNAINNAVGNGNNQLFDRLNNLLNSGLNLGELALLKPIKDGIDLANTKLGPLLKGADGISGFLGRLSSSLGIDRTLNLIAIASNLHNAMMLSASLKVTLLEMLSSVGNATGLLQTSEGDNVDLNAVFNQGIETFMTTILGAENYAGLKVELRKYSAIYRAANNVLSNVGNMFSSIGNGIEVIGERTGKIGNAIRAAGMVRENAYQWMSEKMTVHTNKFMTFQTTVGGVTEVLEAINEVAESTIEGQQSYTEAVKATTEFKKVLAEGTKEGAKDAENKAIALEAAKIKENVSKDPTGEKETGYLSFLTD